MQSVNIDTSMMTENELEFYEQIFNALADKIRLSILQTINQSDSKSLCVCDLEEILELKQSKLSY
ncbi:ArsR/SmtB family transcription factor, partial [Staphylococcus haemolyticus]|uniref:ArsR/SmtB family transcription factor n=1 Tax=Staphylococcus haemolyticus TaxID=1283 RepID=UPI0030C624F4